MALASLNILFRTDIKDFSRKLKKAEFKVQQFGKKTEAMGRSITRNITLPVLGIGAASVKMAAEVESSFTKIETLVGLSGEAVAGMRDEVTKLSRETGRSTKSLADALFTVTSAGLRGEESMKVLEQAAKASAIGLGETRDIAKATTAVLQAYGKENISASRATNILLATVREGNLEASELAPVLGRVIGLASKLGISFEEVGASVATFTRLGVSSEQAITGLRGIMNSLLKSTPQVEKALGKVGLTLDDLRKSVRERGLADTLIDLTKQFEGNEDALSQVIPNIEALAAIFGTAGVQSESYSKILDNILKKNDLLAESFERVGEDAMFQFIKSLNELRLIGIEIGMKVMPIALKLAERIRELAGRFHELSDSQLMARLKIIGIVAAAGPLLSIFGKMIVLLPRIAKAWRVLNRVMLSNPFLAVASAIIGLGVALAGYLKKIKGVKSEQGELNEELEKTNKLLSKQDIIMSSLQVDPDDSLEELNSELKRLKAHLKDLRETGGGVDEWYGSGDNTKFIEEEIEAVMGQVAALETLIARKRQILGLEEKELEAVKKVNDERSKIPQIQEQEPIGTPAETIGNVVVAEGDFPLVQRTTEQIGKSLAERSSMWDAQIEKTKEAADKTAANYERMNKAAVHFGVVAQQAIMQGVDAISEGITAMVAGTGTLDNVFQNIINVVADFMSALGKALIASAIASEAFQDLLLTNPPLAIAAGVALVATAAIVKGMLQKGPEVPALAEGGAAFGETLAIVGDNPNARSDPEVISPFSKIRGMLDNAINRAIQSGLAVNREMPRFEPQMAGVETTQNIKISGQLRAKGRDLYTVWEQEKNVLNRN